MVVVYCGVCYCKYTSDFAGLFHDHLKIMYIIVHGIKCFHMFLRWLEEHSLIDVVITLCQRLYTGNP